MTHPNTTDTLPADILRAAANRIRQLADAALGNDRPWRYAKGLPDDSVRTATGRQAFIDTGPGAPSLHALAVAHHILEGEPR